MDINTGERIKRDERNLPLETILLMEVHDPLLVGFAKKKQIRFLTKT